MKKAKIKKRIMVVEDEPTIRKVLKLKLENSGYEVFEAANGKEALDVLKKTNFDLLILDLMMPVMDGFTLLEKLDKRVPVLVNSNLSQKEDYEKVRIYEGVLDYFVKSEISLFDLVKKVEKLAG